MHELSRICNSRHVTIPAGASPVGTIRYRETIDAHAQMTILA